MQRYGILSAKEAAEHPERSVIMRALGIDPTVEVDVTEDIPARAGEPGHVLLNKNRTNTDRSVRIEE